MRCHKVPATPSRPGVDLQLSRDEIIEAIEQGARKRRNMTARELLLAYHAGELPEPGQVADLLVLADLLAPDDPQKQTTEPEQKAPPGSCPASGPTRPRTLARRLLAPPPSVPGLSTLTVQAKGGGLSE